LRIFYFFSSGLQGKGLVRQVSCGANALGNKCFAKQGEIKGKVEKLGVLTESWKGKPTCLRGIISQNELQITFDHLKKIPLALW
jgi:hypothetical protein